MPADDAHDPQDEAVDDVRRRFAQALERKRSRNAPGQPGVGDEQSGKAHGSSGPAKQQRTFRRKSG